MPSYDVFVKIRVVEAEDEHDAWDYVEVALEHIWMNGVPTEDTECAMDDYKVMESKKVEE